MKMRSLIEALEIEESGTDSPPPGYEIEKHTVVVSKAINNHAGGSDFEFELNRKRNLYDDYLKDYLGSIGVEADEAFKAMRKAGYSDDEIKELMDEINSVRKLDTVKLKKPIKIVVPLFKTKKYTK